MGTSDEEVEGKMHGDAGAGLGALKGRRELHEVRANPGAVPASAGVDQAEDFGQLQAAGDRLGR